MSFSDIPCYTGSDTLCRVFGQMSDRFRLLVLEICETLLVVSCYPILGLTQVVKVFVLPFVQLFLVKPLPCPPFIIYSGSKHVVIEGFFGGNELV